MFTTTGITVSATLTNGLLPCSLISGTVASLDVVVVEAGVNVDFAASGEGISHPVASMNPAETHNAAKPRVASKRRGLSLFGNIYQTRINSKLLIKPPEYRLAGSGKHIDKACDSGGLLPAGAFGSTRAALKEDVQGDGMVPV